MSFDDLVDGLFDTSAAATADASSAPLLRSVPSPGSADQLTLLPAARTDEIDWVLDSRTKQLGRLGVAAAREVLARATPPDANDDVAA